MIRYWRQVYGFMIEIYAGIPISVICLIMIDFKSLVNYVFF